MVKVQGADDGQEPDPGPLLPDNPAGQLLAFLEAAQATNQQQPCLNALREIFGLLDAGVVMQLFGEVMQLSGRIEAQIAEIDDADPELFMSWRPGIDEGFSQMMVSLGSAWEGYVRQINAADVRALQFCEHRLRQRGSAVRQRRLDELERSIFDLYEEIEGDPTINAELRRVMLHHLLRLRIAVVTYRFGGAEALRDELAATSFAVLAAGAGPATDKDTPPGKLWGVLGKVAVVLSLAKAPLELANEAAAVLDQLP